MALRRLLEAHFEHSGACWPNGSRKTPGGSFWLAWRPVGMIAPSGPLEAYFGWLGTLGAEWLPADPVDGNRALVCCLGMNLESSLRCYVTLGAWWFDVSGCAWKAVFVAVCGRKAPVCCFCMNLVDRFYCYLW